MVAGTLQIAKEIKYAFRATSVCAAEPFGSPVLFVLSATCPRHVHSLFAAWSGKTETIDSESDGDGIHTFVGDEPDEVIVQIKGCKLVISVFSRRWDVPSSLVVHPIQIAQLNWRRIPFELLQPELTSLIETARKIRRSKFRKCLKCGDTKPPEWMHDEQTCQSCSGAIY